MQSNIPTSHPPQPQLPRSYLHNSPKLPHPDTPMMMGSKIKLHDIGVQHPRVNVVTACLVHGEELETLEINLDNGRWDVG